MLENEKKLSLAEQFINDRIRGWMLKDLDISIKYKLNYLSALACLIYTEVIGAFLPPLEDEKGKIEERNFYRCFYRLSSGQYLQKLDNTVIKLTNRNLYQHLRHSMAHKYFPSISKKMDDGSYRFMSAMMVAKDVYFRGVNGGRRKRTAPLYADRSGFNIATRNYYNELKKIVKITERRISKDTLWQKSAIKGYEYLLEYKR